ncbi:MAG: hypothetical protein KJZ80_02485 [Hyphomicrobiaceae bacterium]|nr:hypothetical protein [Hyphomicrobiaceae bacterium]
MDFMQDAGVSQTDGLLGRGACEATGRDASARDRISARDNNGVIPV